MTFLKRVSASTYKFLQRFVKAFTLYSVTLKLYHNILKYFSKSMKTDFPLHLWNFHQSRCLSYLSSNLEWDFKCL